MGSKPATKAAEVSSEQTQTVSPQTCKELPGHIHPCNHREAGTMDVKSGLWMDRHFKSISGSLPDVSPATLYLQVTNPVRQDLSPTKACGCHEGLPCRELIFRTRSPCTNLLYCPLMSLSCSLDLVARACMISILSEVRLVSQHGAIVERPRPIKLMSLVSLKSLELLQKWLRCRASDIPENGEMLDLHLSSCL